MTRAIVTTTASTPTQTPALKIPSTTEHPVNAAVLSAQHSTRDGMFHILGTVRTARAMSRVERVPRGDGPPKDTRDGADLARRALLFLDRLRRVRLRICRRRTASGVLTVFGRSVLVLAGFELLYLLVANLALRTNAARAAIESARGIKLEYAAAHSIWPGRVAVEGLRLRFEDYNVQFQLTIQRTRFDLSLHELALRRFHVLSVQAEGVTYRLRHKVHSAQGNEARLDAYPRIEGFGDPPLYQGAPAAEVDDKSYKLWEIHIENVVASVRELWILEYRFQGRAEASGAFLLRPKRWVQVTPGVIRFHQGPLLAGSHLVAATLQGLVRCEVPGFDVRSAPGLQVFRQILAQIDLSFSDGDLGSLDPYTVPRWGLSLAGSRELEAHVRFDRGRLAPGTSLQMQSSGFHARFDRFDLAGEMRATLVREPESEKLRLHLAAQARAAESGPIVKRFEVDTALDGADVTEPRAFEDALVSVQAAVPEIAWFGRVVDRGGDLHLTGTSTVELEFRRRANGLGEGRLTLGVNQVGCGMGEDRVRLSGNALARFRTEEKPEPFAQGAISLNATGAESLLSLALGAFLRPIAANGLGLGELSATVAFHVSPTRLQLELTRARSGALRARGHLQGSWHTRPRGAVLFASGPLRLGVTLLDGRLRISPLAGPDWLEHTHTARSNGALD